MAVSQRMRIPRTRSGYSILDAGLSKTIRLDGKMSTVVVCRGHGGSVMKSGMIAMMVAVAAGVAYYAGSQRSSMNAASTPVVEPEAKIITVPPATPVETTIKNPTEVLLGEAAV